MTKLEISHSANPANPANHPCLVHQESPLDGVSSPCDVTGSSAIGHQVSHHLTFDLYIGNFICSFDLDKCMVFDLWPI